VSSLAEKSLALCHLFEAELLLELMLRHWDHPLAEVQQYRAALLENITQVLEAAVDGRSFIEGLPPSNMNFVAAAYYAELRSLEDPGADPETMEQRETWLARVRSTLPSCFCDPDLLD